MSSSLTTPVNVHNRTYWMGFIQAVNTEAAYELGLQDNINPEAVRNLTDIGWKAERFSPNILPYIDLSSRTTHEHHYHATTERPMTEAERKEKKKEEEENSLHKYRLLGPLISAIGGFLAAYTWRGYQRCWATYNYTFQAMIELESKIFQSSTPIKPDLMEIVKIKLKVDRIRISVLGRYLITSVGILIGGGLLAWGGLAKDPRFITCGGIVLAISAVWAAASAGFHLQDKKEIRSLYQRIASNPDRLADKALSNLKQYAEEITQRIYSPMDPNRRREAERSGVPPFPAFYTDQEPISPNPDRGPGGYPIGSPINERYENAPSAPYVFA